MEGYIIPALSVERVAQIRATSEIWVPHLRRVFLRLRWAFALRGNRFHSRFALANIAQALTEPMPILSADHIFASYGIRLVR